MDHHTALTHPLEDVFRHLATPACLGNWLPEVAQVQTGPIPPGVGDVFSLALDADGDKRHVTGDLIAYEPPWSVAYRLLSGPRALVLRVTCTSGRGITTVHVRQSEDLPPLVVDLDRLGRALDSAAAAAPPGTQGTSSNG
jgi:hypothetical protein